MNEEKEELEVSTIVCTGCGSIWVVQSPNMVVADLVECPLCHFKADECGEEEEEHSEGEFENPKIAKLPAPFIA